MSIGDRIRSMREAHGISQTDLADKVGISKQTLYKYEKGIVTNVPSDKIEAIADALNVSPGYLMGWEDMDYSAAIADMSQDMDDAQLERLSRYAGLIRDGIL